MASLLPREIEFAETAPVRIDARERIRAFVGAGIGILAAAVVCRWFAGSSPAWPWRGAPIWSGRMLMTSAALRANAAVASSTLLCSVSAMESEPTSGWLEAVNPDGVVNRP